MAGNLPKAFDEYDFTRYAYPGGSLRSFLRFHVLRDYRYHILIALVIFANAFTIGLTLNSTFFTAIIFEGIFCLVFTVDLLIKVLGLGVPGYMRENWNMFDVVLLVLQYIQIGIMFIEQSSSPFVRIFSALRVLRIFRLLKSISTMPKFRQLWILMFALKSGFWALLWVSGLIVLVIYGLSIVVLAVIRSPLTDNVTYPCGKFTPYMLISWTKEDYWGSLQKTMLTLLQVLTLDNWSDHIARPLIFQEHDLTYRWTSKEFFRGLTFGLFFVLFIWYVTFGFVQVIVGVMSEAGQVYGKENQAILRKESLARDMEVYSVLGRLLTETRMEENNLEELMKRKTVRKVLRLVDLSHREIMEFFKFYHARRIEIIIAMSGTGNAGNMNTPVINVEDFSSKCPRLFGIAKGKELVPIGVEVSCSLKRMNKAMTKGTELDAVLDYCSEDLENLNELVRKVVARKLKIGFTESDKKARK